ncbi:G-type lectin S-receptor-like serine/threonine-protein kinase At2g19130 [Phalaenopsis equestris]|uniref:G-type lectin S-receptor-like serine/threonine-protein kinase At2g19130 n=1 Tax=Phalaenopsis equestris TaxID=78828 RepID=UPI0009E3D640|nr:G-type lectin S-receptor-like serine/threonine-protein kinase At2g19130 [Phalaenopsis equestris]
MKTNEKYAYTRIVSLLNIARSNTAISALVTERNSVMAFMLVVHLRSMISSLLRIVFFSVLFSANASLSASADTIYVGQSLTGSQTIISKEGNFVLGFFSPGKTSNFYIGIWYKKISKQTVIWVANREKPVYDTSSAEFKLSNNGHLALLDNLKNLIWSSNSTHQASNSTAAALLDNGNLVLRDLTNNTTGGIIWQSFDHPTDTYVPGSWIGMNKITGEYQTLTSWKNSEDPSPGYFSETIDPSGTSEFFLEWNKSKKYWRSGLWNGNYFTAVPILPDMKPHTIVTVIYVDNKERRYTSCFYRDPSSSKITRHVMDVNGQIKQFVWVDNIQDWVLFFSRPTLKCDVYFLCGPFGICDEKSSFVCSCAHGFQPASFRNWELNDWSSGCARKTKMQCSGNVTDDKVGFLKMPNMFLPSNPVHLTAYNLEDCRSVCLSECLCTAYAYNGSGCLTWNEDLQNLQQLYDGDESAQTLYVRLASSDLPSSSGDNKRSVIIICTAILAGVGAILCALLLLALRYRSRRFISIRKTTEGPLVRYTYAELQYMTRNFSDKLGGGGFGTVFKGTLPNSNALAVKRLEGVQQGEKQFRTEVSTLGFIQHINLINLRGFCSEGTKRLLVYDYMQNGSLDSHLFKENCKVLSWRARYEIIKGIARGLAYLHENCRECIVHCDIKPENILLDENNCPKLADFGMAKLIGKNFSRVLTTMRGTVGYLAPEWISGLPITPKADVYSFGMMLFEIISGRRNINHQFEFVFFPAWAATKIWEGEFLVLLDERLKCDVLIEELVTASRIASWCIQDSESHRPSMGQIVQILENLAEVNVPPVPGSLQVLTENKDLESDVYYSAVLSLS